MFNAILKRRGASTSLMTTGGFRDILTLQRANPRVSNPGALGVLDFNVKAVLALPQRELVAG